MNVSVIQELKDFESKQESILESNKKQFLEVLEEQEKKILEENEMEIYEISSNKHRIIKKAQKKAKEQAVETINEFKEKTKKMQEASGNTEEAVNLIFQEFLNQNV